MPYKYSTYLKFLHYNRTLDFWWYDELKKKLDVLEAHKIKINISELNKYLYNRYQYERCMIYKFNDTKYDIENYMQVIIYNDKMCDGYDGDDEETKKEDIIFTVTMNRLADKLEQFTITC
jgi:hypothetical protein